MKSIALQKQNTIDTAGPNVFDRCRCGVLEDASDGSTETGSALPEVKQRYRAILKHQFQLTGLLSPDGRLIVVNEVALAFAGIAESEVSGRLFWECPWWAHSTDAQGRLKAAIQEAAGGKPVRYETTNLDKDGDIRNIDFILSPILDENGDVIYLVPEGLDVTEAKKRETALMESEERYRQLAETASDAAFEKRDLQERLLQAQKMEAVGTLAAGIAHDFNNILAPIVGYSELTMTQVQDNSQVQNYQHQILKAALRARDLIQQILTFSRKGDTVIKPVKVKTILKETLKLIRASLPSNIDIEQAIDSEGVVLSSPTHVQQVVMNLCTNAGHAMKENGGLLRVGLSEVTLGEDFTNQYADLSPGPFLKLTVGDTGHGISPEIQRHIFDPYFTTKKQGEGTGLGLSLVHGIVKECRGEIAVESEPGKGALFTIYLPAVPEPENEERRSVLATPGGSERVLLVDDEKSILQIYARFLKHLGYSVTTRLSSIEALAAFRANPNAYDLVITDMMMPDMTGEKLAKEVLEVRPDMPIILNSGYSDGTLGKSAKTIGVDALLMKPVIMSDLAVTIRQLLDSKTKESLQAGRKLNDKP